jgi:NAD(P)-dependent dehydrogenase (short-subunit alcohol dehydrogenase family)
MNVNLRGAFVTMRECGRAMRDAQRPGSIVAVTSVSGFLTDRLPGYRERVAQRSALGRLGTAGDVADTIVSLLQLDWVTGQVLAADGGVSLASPIDPLDSL